MGTIAIDAVATDTIAIDAVAIDAVAIDTIATDTITADSTHPILSPFPPPPPQVLELRYPVLLESFSIDHGSGGAGQWQGGAGVTRTIRFLEAMEVVLLSNRRLVPPYGIKGGREGRPGRAWVERKVGSGVAG